MIQVTKKIIRFILQDRNKIPLDSSSWPLSWKTVSYKIYTRIIGSKLLINNAEEYSTDSIYNLLRRRATSRDFTDKTIKSEDIIKLISLAAGTKETGKVNRVYPSGGGLYPVEIYYLNLKEKLETSLIMKRGLYHFSPIDNSLSCIKTIPNNLTQESLVGSTYRFTNNADGFIIFTLTPKRNVPKYGWLGIRLGLIEIGAIIQNIYLIGMTLSINCCALAGFNAEMTDELLEIDGLNEISIMTVAIG